MSFQAMTWAVKQKVPAMQKIVLLMMANRTNPDNGLCFPSHERLADDCGMSKRSVIQQIAKLENDGFLKVIRSKNSNGVKVVNRYKLNIINSERDSLGSERDALGVVNVMHYGSERDALGGSERDAHKTESFLNKKETQTTNSENAVVVVDEKIEKQKQKNVHDILAQITDKQALAEANKQMGKDGIKNPIAYASVLVSKWHSGDLGISETDTEKNVLPNVNVDRNQALKAFINKGDNRSRLLADKKLLDDRFINVKALGVVTYDELKHAGLWI